MIGRVIYHAKMAAAIFTEKARIEVEDAREWASLIRDVLSVGGPREYVDGIDSQADALHKEKLAAVAELGHLTATLGDAIAPLVLLLWPEAAAPVVEADGSVTRATFQPLSGGRTLRTVVAEACARLGRRAEVHVEDTTELAMALHERNTFAAEAARVKKTIDPFLLPWTGEDLFSNEHIRTSLLKTTREASECRIAKARVETLEAEVSKLQAQAQHAPELVKSRRKRDEERINRALANPCPECAVEAKEPCVSKVTDSTGSTKLVRRAPHPKRFEVAFPPPSKDSKDSPPTSDGENSAGNPPGEEQSK